MAIKIEGKGRVWAKDHDGWTSYTIGISNKTQDGTWINAYQQVRFRKNEKVPNGTDIEFVAFPTVKKALGRVTECLLVTVGSLIYTLSISFTKRLTALYCVSPWTMRDLAALMVSISFARVMAT